MQSFYVGINLVSSSGQGLVHLGQIPRGSLLSLGLECSGGLLLLEVNLGLRATLVLEPVHKLLVLPPDAVGELSHVGVLPSGLEADDTKRGGDDLALHLVVGVGNSLERAQAADGGLSPRRLLVDHATDGTPDHARGRSEVEGSLAGIGVHALVAELGILGLVTDEGSADDHLLATDEDDLLAGEEFLGHNGAQAAMEVVAAVDDDRLLENHRFFMSTGGRKIL